MSCRREALFESYVNMLYHHCSETPGTYSVLREVLQRAIKEFPNNIYFLTTATKLLVSTVLFICTSKFPTSLLSHHHRHHFTKLCQNLCITVHSHY